MPSKQPSLTVERMNLRTLVFVLLLTLSGIVLLLWAANQEWWLKHEVWHALVRESGALLLVTCILTLFWDFFGKRAFVDEILAKARISQELLAAGVLQVTDSFQRPEIDWTELFRNAKQLDIFVAYARTWRNQHRDEIQTLLSREGAAIRVVLPDPQMPELVNELARRFNCTPQQMVERINEAIEYFRELRATAQQHGSHVEIWVVPIAPQFSQYRFDDRTVIALYTHQRRRVSVPTLLCQDGGILAQFARADFSAMTDPGGAGRAVE